MSLGVTLLEEDEGLKDVGNRGWRRGLLFPLLLILVGLVVVV